MGILEIVLIVFGIGFLGSTLVLMALATMYEKDIWIYRKRNALKALVTNDLDSTETKPVTDHLLAYYKPHKITPKLIEYFEDNYPKVLEKEQKKRDAEKSTEQAIKNLYHEFSEVQRMNMESFKEIRELGIDNKSIDKEDSWSTTQQSL